MPHVRPSVRGPKTKGPQPIDRSRRIDSQIQIVGPAAQDWEMNLQRIMGCPTSRSFFARCGIPQPSTSVFWSLLGSTSEEINDGAQPIDQLSLDRCLYQPTRFIRF